MSQPAPQHQPGWYPDPWKHAAQRWHDGNDWTHQTHGEAGAAAAASPAATMPHLQPVATPAMVQQRTSGMAITSLVLALLGFGLIAVIFGVVALRQIGRSAGELGGRGLAIAGIIVGAIGGAFVLLLMIAVAVPTFLAQKDAALDTKARANVKQLVTGVESCAAGNVDGTVTGCGAAQVAKLEPALGGLLDACGAPGGGCIELAADNRGYTIKVQNDDGTATFVEEHRSDGQVLRTCDGSGCPSTT